FIVQYSLAAKIAACVFLGLGLFIAYAASRASADQRILAACVGGTLFFATLLIFVEFHFVHVEFDENSIYTFSPWRKRRVIPWSAVISYSFKWHILKTRDYGAIRLSAFMSGLGTMRDQWQNKVLRTQRSSQAPPPQKWL
ncbi:MAG TPA: hypothetical protein VN827_04455, partial [Chthoniobacterales bacterium]|nr:hypothetical protein [Chthoniobacterales bacterium]